MVAQLPSFLTLSFVAVALYGSCPSPRRSRRHAGILAAAAEQKRNYYEVLGVEKDADDKAIKQAYRKMALKWHPDKNPDDRENAEKQFREVAEAYEVLSDPTKRKNYDTHGTADGGFPGGGGGFDFGGFGGGFKDPNDLFKEMFGNADPFSDFSKFFENIEVEVENLGSEKDEAKALDDLEEALSVFYTTVGQPEKALRHKIKEVLQSPKWKGNERKMFNSIRKKYADSQYKSALDALKIAFDGLDSSRGGSSGGFGGGFGNMGGFDFGSMGGGMGDMGGFGGLGDLFGNMGGGFGGFGGGGMGGGATMSFSSFSSSSGGKTVKQETKIVGGKRVTKTIESDGSGTRATLEEQEGGKIKRQRGEKKAEAELPGGSRDEM